MWELGAVGCEERATLMRFPAGALLCGDGSGVLARTQFGDVRSYFVYVVYVYAFS